LSYKRWYLFMRLISFSTITLECGLQKASAEFGFNHISLE